MEMSYWNTMPEERFWETVHRYIAAIPHDGNRDAVLRYIEERKANGIRPATLGIDVNALRSLGIYLGEKRFEDSTKPDLVRYLNNAMGYRSWRNVKADGTATRTVREHRLSFASREKRKEVFRPFFRWLLQLDEDDTIPQLKGIKSRANSHENVPTDELLTPDDLRTMLLHAKHAQARAMIAVLYESGMRAGEFCALNVGSVAFDEFGAVLTLPKDGVGLKTGSRRVRLFDSVSYLQAWYEQHPLKDDSRAPLWITRSSYGTRRLSANTMYAWTKRAAKGAGIKKHVHPHLFRHTAATERARLGWNEGQMRAFFGWSKNSDMPSWYVHLAGLDYENVEIERRGLKGRGPAGPALKPLQCKVCKAANPMTATYCSQCRRPVSPEAEARVEEEKRIAIREEVARLIAQDPEERERIAAAVRDVLGR